MKTKVLIMSSTEFNKTVDNDTFEYNDNTVLIVIDKKTGKISVDMQTECVKSSTCINRIIKAIENNTELENIIKTNIIDWLNCILESVENGVYTDVETFGNNECVYHGYSYSIEFVGDNDYNAWYMYLNFYIDEIVETETTETETETETETNIKTIQEVNSIFLTIFNTS